jgi:hypothetical protein
MPTPSGRPPLAHIDRMIRITDALIAEVVKIDPIATTLLGLAKAELVAKKAIGNGDVLPFSRNATVVAEIAPAREVAGASPNDPVERSNELLF